MGHRKIEAGKDEICCFKYFTVKCNNYFFRFEDNRANTNVRILGYKKV